MHKILLVKELAYVYMHTCLIIHEILRKTMIGLERRLEPNIPILLVVSKCTVYAINATIYGVALGSRVG